ncbi:hypothetical protein QP150_01285 [Sphingomonas sp. 22L2VL55-3]
MFAVGRVGFAVQSFQKVGEAGLLSVFMTILADAQSRNGSTGRWRSDSRARLWRHYEGPT